jgi:hypothetical protein
MKAFGVAVFLTYGLYGHRPITHRDAYMRAPGWLSLELGSLTLEVEWPTKKQPKQQPPSQEVLHHESSLL